VIEAVIFDWAGTLTPWHKIDAWAESMALAQAAVAPKSELVTVARRIHEATKVIWQRSLDKGHSATISDVFDVAGVAHDPELLTPYFEFWQPHTFTDPQAEPLFIELRNRGLKIGVLSNTIWPGTWHEDFFRRDGVHHLIDSAVYSSEIGWSKPAAQAFEAAMEALLVSSAERCMYVGDRLYDDIWGAQQVGLYSVYLPHSNIPDSQTRHLVGNPNATVNSLREIASLLDRS
jgi:putative hydrolase of the HAD superfamily